MSNVMISFLASLGLSVWVYSRMQRQTGDNTTNSLIVSGVAAIFAFAGMMILLSMIPA